MAARALPDLVARIRVDSTGVDSAMTSLVSSFGRANFALAGVAAGIGLLLVGGKSMLDFSEKWDRAERGLTQAINARNAAHGKTLPVVADVVKAHVSLAEATRRLAEFDAAHEGHIVSKTTALKNLGAYTDAVATANRRLAEFDVSHLGKALTAAQNMRREDLVNALAAREAALSAAQGHPGGVTTTSLAGGGLTESQLMHREDLLKKVAKAHAALEAARHAGVAATLIDGPKLESQIDDFIKTNRRYISNQSEVVDGYALLTRSGLTQTEITKDMNRAVDLAALKHISLSEAVNLVNNAEHGRLRGLIDLGITTSQYTDSQGNLIKGSKDVGKAMDELDSKTKHGRDTLTEVQQHSNQLSNDWQDLSKKGGPVLTTLLDTIISKVSDIYDWFDRIGKDDRLWAQISDRLVKMADWINTYLIGPIQRFWNYANRNVDNNNNGVPDVQETAAWQFLQKQKAELQPPPGFRWLYNKDGSIGGKEPFHIGVTPGDLYSGRTGRQYGGSVIPGGVYTVGEAGPETLVMGASGGMVIPNGRGGGDTFHFHQVQADPWAIANQISWTKKTRRL